MITSSATGTSTKAWEFVKNYYNTSAFHPKNTVVVNTRALMRLGKDEQKALREAAACAEKRGWEMAREREKEANDTLAKNGMTIHDPDSAMKAAYAKVGDQILAEWLKKAGPEGDQLIKSYRSGK
jgi:TRAP-type C4-dicarboxylate transport system substrate-binding protein